MLLKQRNIIIRPDNADRAELEMKRMQHFGWERVRDTSYPDGSMLVCFVRDEDEHKDEIEAEKKYRAARLASDFASGATERIIALNGSNAVKKKSMVPSIIFAVLAVLFLAATVVAAVWNGLYSDYLFAGDLALQVSGDWTFFGFSRFTFLNGGLNVVPFLFAGILGMIALLFTSLALFFGRKVTDSNLDSLDYAKFALAEITYYEEVKAQADADIAELYPDDAATFSSSAPAAD